MEAWVAPALVLIGIIVSSAVTWFVAKRTTSGSISTSDAASLWEESNNLRKEYRERAEQLEEQLQKVNNELQRVMGELTKLRASSKDTIRQVDDLKKIIKSLRAKNQRLLAQRRKTV